MHFVVPLIFVPDSTGFPGKNRSNHPFAASSAESRGKSKFRRDAIFIFATLFAIFAPVCCAAAGFPFPAAGKKGFFSQLRGERRTADPAELLFSRQQNGAGRGRSGLYVPAGWLEGLSRMGLASGGSGRPVLGGAGTGARRGR